MPMSAPKPACVTCGGTLCKYEDLGWVGERGRGVHKAHLSDNKAVGASELECNAVGDDGGVAVSNVGKWASVDHDWCALQRLHQCAV